MLTKRIIPCLDIKDGRVVKGINFVSLRDAGDPADNALVYDREGSDEIVFLDITASSEQRSTLISAVERTADVVFMPLTVGGGIKTTDDIKTLLRAGADKVSINTQAVLEPDFVKKASYRFGAQCIVVAIDAKKVQDTPPLRERGQMGSNSISRWEVYIYGGRKQTGIDVLNWAVQMEKAGAGEILLTSMDRDGTKSGYDIELLKEVTKRVGIPVIVSGGAGSMEHFYEGFVAGGADACLAASLFHFRELSIKSLKSYLYKKGINVRMV
ncbi:MAG: imidazole glycerol phosphate synthase subunit HisF [Deltaproteobacteria bacterium]|nr:imidazole glycerol phosphate synthase subunit HisF [Deltaproteobacteria bacterium]MCL5791484.1 imidazole glycerol phosphate synthase subunit HisF [Deltaproteobacteria bacterium]